MNTFNGIGSTLQPIFSSSSVQLGQKFIKNHQNWQISQNLDFVTGSPTFHLKDSLGTDHTVSEFVVENLDQKFIETLSRCTLVKERQKLVNEYLQNLLDKATSLSVHVERYGDKLYLRFGEYGLEDEVQPTKNTGSYFGYDRKFALFVSLGGVYVEIVLGGKGRNFLASEGMAGFGYVYNTDTNQFNWKEYVKESRCGVAGALIFKPFAKVAQGADKVSKVAIMALGGGVEAAAPQVIADLVEYFEKDDKDKELKIRDMFLKVADRTVGGVKGSGIGELLSTLTSIVLASAANDRTVINTLKKLRQGELPSVGNNVVSNLYENMQETDSEKRKTPVTLLQETLKSPYVNIMLDGLITLLEQMQKNKEYQQLKSNEEQAQKKFDEARMQQDKSEKNLRDLWEPYKQSLLDYRGKLEFVKQLKNNKLQLETVQQQINKDQQAINGESTNVNKSVEAFGAAQQALQDAQQALQDAQQQFEKCENAIADTKKIIKVNDAQFSLAVQEAEKARQPYHQLVSAIDKDIKGRLKNRYKAKIDGHLTQNEELIRNEYLKGKDVKWKNEHSPQEKVKIKTSPFSEIYQQVQEYVKQTQQKKINKLMSSINRMKTEITDDELKLQQQSLDKPITDIKTTQKYQMNVLAIQRAKEKLTSYQNVIRQAKQDMITIQNLEKKSRLFKEKFKEEFKEELGKFQRLPSEVIGFEKLTREQQEAVFQVLNDNFLSTEVVKTNVKKACETESVSSVKGDCTLADLVPHIVLVHALNHIDVPDFISAEITLYEKEEDRILFVLKKFVTPDGSIGNHLKLKKTEYNQEFQSRPHIHWSWNQLVQPNGVKKFDGTAMNNWEPAKLAFLEPLSTFENSTNHRPFGVAPYDTFTFDSHRFSDQSTLLVPQALVDKVKIALPNFRGQICPYDGRKDLRGVVIDGLNDYYPDTWHMCDPKGNLTGRVSDYSPGGYSPQTCIKKTDGTVIALLKESGIKKTDHESQSFKKWDKNQRFVGLHINSMTFRLEDQRNVYFKTLSEFKKNNTRVKGNSLFAGSQKDISTLPQLGVLEAFKFYHEATKYDSKTGVIDVANYIIKEAICADLVSLFYQMDSKAKFNLTTLDLEMIFDSTQFDLINLLEEIEKNINSKDRAQQTKAWAFFDSKDDSTSNSYCSILRQSWRDLESAKVEVSKLNQNENEKKEPYKIETPDCLLAAQDEWEKVEVPSNDIQFDLGKNRPHSEKLSKYVNIVIKQLPSNIEKLKLLYQQILSFSQVPQTPEENHAQYRLNVVGSMVLWSLQEKIYLAKRKRSGGQSFLANKVSMQIESLTEYGLETNDFTSNSGDCLFDNILAQLPKGKLTSLKMRQKLIQHMKYGATYSDKPDYKKKLLKGVNQEITFTNWEDYLDKMNQPNVWATELEIQALAKYLDHPIVLFAEGILPKIYNIESQKDPLFLHHLNANHFESCIPSKGQSAKDIYDAIKKDIE